MNSTPELIRELVKGLNITDSEVARSGHIARSLAADGIFRFHDVLPEEIVGPKALLQKLQTERWQKPDTQIKLIGDILTNEDEFRVDFQLVNSTDQVLATGALSGKTNASSPKRIQEVNLDLDSVGTSSIEGKEPLQLPA